MRGLMGVAVVRRRIGLRKYRGYIQFRSTRSIVGEIRDELGVNRCYNLIKWFELRRVLMRGLMVVCSLYLASNWVTKKALTIQPVPEWAGSAMS